jgi:uncharacterized membrane protein (UPF0127 family)
MGHVAMTQLGSFAMLLRTALLAISFVISSPGWAQQPQLPLLELSAGMHRIEAEVAATPESRQTGMMLRTSMPSHRGMLFVFPEPSKHCMWMRNTLVPLSVAFLDEKGQILNIEDMQPRTEDNHCSAKPARYALEMNLGWFRTRGVGAGFAITGVDKAPPGR